MDLPGIEPGTVRRGTTSPTSTLENWPIADKVEAAMEVQREIEELRQRGREIVELKKALPAKPIASCIVSGV